MKTDEIKRENLDYRGKHKAKCDYCSGLGHTQVKCFLRRAKIKQLVLTISKDKLSNGPNMEINNKYLHRGKAPFLIDTGSKLNVLKQTCLRRKPRVDRS